VPDFLLRQLGPAPVTVQGQDLARLLAPAYEAMSSAAERRALGVGARDDGQLTSP
jgi:hypothetical protein